MIEHRENGLLVLQFNRFRAFPEIHHGVFTRIGGYSLPPFQGLNMSLDVGDDYGHVERNRQALMHHIQGENLVFVKQKHGDQVVIFNQKNPWKKGLIPVGDALVTNKPGLFLIIQVADCQAILLYDPVRRVVANIHAGWRGSIKNISQRTLEKMRRFFSCNPKDVVAAIGPSLGPCCGEFINYRDEIPESFWKYKGPSHHFDFWSISRDQLLSEGIKDENIEVSRICTKCHTDRFYSYRRERITGRFAVSIGLI